MVPAVGIEPTTRRLRVEAPNAKTASDGGVGSDSAIRVRGVYENPQESASSGLAGALANLAASGLSEEALRDALAGLLGAARRASDRASG